MAWRKRLTGKWFTLERILVTTDESETRLLRRWHIRGANRKKKTRIISLHWQFRSTRITASNQLNLRPFCLLDFSVWWKISSSFFFFFLFCFPDQIFSSFLNEISEELAMHGFYLVISSMKIWNISESTIFLSNK